MISAQHVHEEIEVLEKVAETVKKDDPVAAANIKALCIANKLMLTIRQNQVRIMEHQKVPMVRTKRDGQKETSQENSK